MISLGMKHHIVRTMDWVSLDIRDRPTKMPEIPTGDEVVCGLDQCEGEEIFICETLEDMQNLYDEYAAREWWCGGGWGGRDALNSPTKRHSQPPTGGHRLSSTLPWERGKIYFKCIALCEFLQYDRIVSRM